MGIKATIYNTLKLLLFGVVLYLLYRQTDTLSFKNFHLTISKTAIVAAFLLFQFRYVLLGVRIYYSATLQGIPVSIGACIALIYRTWFMAFIVPLPNSEDIFKFLFFKKQQVPANKALQIIFYDRMGALFSLLFWGLICLLLVLYRNEAYFFSNTLLASYGSGLLVFLFAITYKWWLKKLIVVLNKSKSQLIKKCLRPLADLSLARIPVRAVTVAFLLSLLYHGCAFLFIIVLLDNNVDTAQWANIGLGLPLFYFSNILPISYNGFGLYETAMFVYLTFLALPAAIVLQITSFHLIFDAVVILIGGVGAIINKDILKYRENKK